MSARFSDILTVVCLTLCVTACVLHFRDTSFARRYGIGPWYYGFAGSGPFKRPPPGRPEFEFETATRGVGWETPGLCFALYTPAAIEVKGPNMGDPQRNSWARTMHAHDFMHLWHGVGYGAWTWLVTFGQARYEVLCGQSKMLLIPYWLIACLTGLAPLRRGLSMWHRRRARTIAGFPVLSPRTADSKTSPAGSSSDKPAGNL